MNVCYICYKSIVMKKVLIILSAFVLVLLASCSKEQIQAKTEQEAVPVWQDQSSSAMIVNNSTTDFGYNDEENDDDLDLGSDITDPDEDLEREGE